MPAAPSCATSCRTCSRATSTPRRLTARTLLLSELLDREPDHFGLPRLERRALVHGHCHHKAVLGMDAERCVLDRLGLSWELLDFGCCGMAGSFGYESGERYRVSIAAGERVLLPAVRHTPADTLIVSDGFPCRQQIADRHRASATPRRHHRARARRPARLVLRDALPVHRRGDLPTLGCPDHAPGEGAVIGERSRRNHARPSDRPANGRFDQTAAMPHADAG